MQMIENFHSKLDFICLIFCIILICQYVYRIQFKYRLHDFRNLSYPLLNRPFLIFLLSSVIFKLRFKSLAFADIRLDPLDLAENPRDLGDVTDVVVEYESEVSTGRRIENEGKGQDMPNLKPSEFSGSFAGDFSELSMQLEDMKEERSNLRQNAAEMEVQLRKEMSNGAILKSRIDMLMTENNELRKELNFLKKMESGGPHTNEDISYSLLYKFTVMQALHSMYVIYRTPFMMLRHHYEFYSNAETFLRDLVFHRIPELVSRFFHITMDILRGWMHSILLKSLVSMKIAYESNAIIKKRLSQLGSCLDSFAGTPQIPPYLNFGVICDAIFRHLQYWKIALENWSLSESVCEDFTFPGALWKFYVSAFLHLWNFLTISTMRRVCSFSMLFVDTVQIPKEFEEIKLYGQTPSAKGPWLPSWMRVERLYFIFRELSLKILQKADSILDSCFNHAGALNPEFAALTPKVFSDRIAFISVIILFTTVIGIAIKRILCFIHLIVTSLFGGGGSKGTTESCSRIKLWYQRSFIRWWSFKFLKGKNSQSSKYHFKRKVRYHPSLLFSGDHPHRQQGSGDPSTLQSPDSKISASAIPNCEQGPSGSLSKSGLLRSFASKKALKSKNPREHAPT